MQPDDIYFLHKKLSEPVEAFDQAFRRGLSAAPVCTQDGALFHPRSAADGQAFQDRDLDLRERLAGLRSDEAVPAVHGRAVHDDRQKMQGKRSGARRRAVSIHGGVEAPNQFAVDCLPGDAVSIHGGVEAAMECQFKTKSRKKRKKT